MARTFIALTPDKSLNNSIIELKKGLKKGMLEGKEVVWQENNHHHLTLLFIGEMEPEQTDELFQGIKGIITSRTPIALEINKISCFPSPLSQAIVAEVTPSAQILKINERISKIATIIGFENPIKKYRPHITIGRFKEKNKSVLEFIDLEELPKGYVSNIDVYESEFDAGKPIFKLIKSFKN